MLLELFPAVAPDLFLRSVGIKFVTLSKVRPGGYSKVRPGGYSQSPTCFAYDACAFPICEGHFCATKLRMIPSALQNAEPCRRILSALILHRKTVTLQKLPADFGLPPAPAQNSTEKTRILSGLVNFNIIQISCMTNSVGFWHRLCRL
jgi:hypothetical protein